MKPSVVVVCMGGVGHLQALLPLVVGLCARGVTVHVMTDADFRMAVEREGARFIDLYARHPLAAADATSIPLPSRYVTFAGVYAESVTTQVAALAPRLIVYDMFAVVGPLVARALGIPYVAMCSNHAPVPARVLAALRQDRRVATSDACWAAVRRLQDVHGLHNASPFSYADSLSPYLNVYGEPEEFLSAEDRAALEPIAFFGVLGPPVRPGSSTLWPKRTPGGAIYVSFGTVIWSYFSQTAVAALSVIAETLADRDVEVRISRGRHPLPASALQRIERSNVRVVDYVDQWRALADADAFLTHHGTNSTHESIFQQTPMLSYPFFGDQPALARRCQELGLALPLTAAPQDALDPSVLLHALQRLADERQRFAARLAEARAWEQRTIDGRAAVIDRILSLAMP